MQPAMTPSSAEEGDVVRRDGSSSRQGTELGLGQSPRQRQRLRQRQRTGCLLFLLSVWVAVLTAGLAIDLCLRYIPRALPTDRHPTYPTTQSPTYNEKHESSESKDTFFDLLPIVKDDPKDGHRHELVPLTRRPSMEKLYYWMIMKDGLYLLGGQVTLNSESTTNISITIRKSSGGEGKGETILEGHIAMGTRSTGFLGRILLLEAGSHISMNSTDNAKFKSVNVDLSSLAIYRLGDNPAT